MIVDPPPRNPQRPAFGVAQWFQFGDYASAERQIAAIERLRIQHVRCGVSWADYHREHGEQWYDWLIRALARRTTVLPCVSCTPPSLGIEPASASPPRDPKAYADFLDRLITRLGVHFDAVELWNEPNNLLDWDWRIDPDWQIYSAMIGKAAHWMQRRGKITVLGGMCPTDLNWLRLIGQRGVLQWIDVVALHAFPGTWTPHFPGWEQEIGSVRDVLREFGWRRDIWITETGYATWRHDEPEQVGAILSALKAPADRIYWYSLADLDPSVASQEGLHFDERHYHTGLIRADGSNKLAARLLEQGGVAALESFSSVITKPYLKPVRAPVVITGGCGFIGINLADALAERGENVLLLDNFSRSGVEENAIWIRRRHPTLAECEPGDVRDARSLQDAIKGAGAVLHLGAQTAVTSSLTSPAQDFEINAAGTLHVLEAVRLHAPTAPVLFASTNKVYGKLLRDEEIVRGDDDCAPADSRLHNGIDESAALDFYSPYGCSKGSADQYVRDYARVFGLRTAVLRMSCIYGRRQFGTEDQGWLAHFFIRAIRGQEITIYGDGRQVRDVLYIDDAVDAWLGVLDAIGRCSGGVFNLGGGPRNAISLLQAIDLIGRRRGLRPRLRFAPARPGDQDWYVSDTSALQAAIPWKARTKVSEGLRRLERWLEQRFGNDAESRIPEEARIL